MNTGMSLRLFAATLALASFTCSPKPGGQTRGPIVIMIPGRLAPEGSFEDCVYQEMQGGKKLKDALADCAKLVPPDLAGTGLDALDLMDGGTGVQLSDCYGAWNRNAPLEDDAAFSDYKRWKSLRDSAFNSFQILDYLAKHEKDRKERERLEELAKDARAAYDEAAREYRDHYYRLRPIEKAELEGRDVGDFPTPDDNTGVARPAGSESQSLCEQVSQFVGECNRDGWRTPQCQRFLDAMKGCADRTVADPVNPGEPCDIPAVTPETARDVMLLHCWAVRHPMPGEDPCTAHGQAFEYFIRTGPPGRNPCNDPYVRQTGEDCYPTFTLVRFFGDVDVRELIKTGFDKFGGPVFVIPVGPPGTEPDPNPRPKPTQPGD